MITTGDKQNQRAGDNSQQLQVTNLTINNGIDEKRAREIYEEMNLKLRRDYTDEALQIATSRVSEFENKLMPKMEAVDGALEAFGDPSFQLLLLQAQKTAAASERPADYDLLAELLLHRFQKGENRIARAGISRAVEVVDKIADDALLGLTAFHSILAFAPRNSNISGGLDALNTLFNKIIYDKLPTGNDWIDHLEILDTVRLNPMGRLNKLEQFYPSLVDGWVDIGIEKGSENYNKAITILNASRLPTNILVTHELNNNFVRVNLANKIHIETLTLNQRHPNNQTLSINLSFEQKNAMKSIYDLYKEDDLLKSNNISKFMEEWDKRSNLKTLREWWDNTNVSFQITSVGKVLAHSNAQRCDNQLPSLD